MRPCKKEPLDIPLKKAKLIEDKYLLDYQYQVLLAQYQRQNSYHGFRPWAAPSAAAAAASIPAKHLPHLPYPVPPSLPYLSQEPPILQNPERVVRVSECERYEQSYQPNVALVPRNGSSLSVSLVVFVLFNSHFLDILSNRKLPFFRLFRSKAFLLLANLNRQLLVIMRMVHVILRIAQ